MDQSRCIILTIQKNNKDIHYIIRLEQGSELDPIGNVSIKGDIVSVSCEYNDAIKIRTNYNS